MRLAVAAADNVRAPRGVLLLITGGPGQPGVPALARIPKILGAELHDYRVVVLRPARHRRRGARLSRVAVRDGQLRSLAAVAGRRPRVLPAAGCTAAVLRHGRRRRRHGVAPPRARRRPLDARRHLIRLVRRRAVRARPSRSRAATRARLRRPACRPDRPRGGRVSRDGARAPIHLRTTCVADLAAVVHTRHNGAQLLDALTLLSIVDPTYRTSFDVPRLLQRGARRQPHRPEQLPGDGSPLERDAGRGARPGPARERALCGLAVPVGSSAAPLAGREAKLRRAVAKLPAARLAPFDRATAPARGSCVSACRGRRQRRHRSTGAG